MGYRIARGAVLGILLGVVGGMLIAGMVHGKDWSLIEQAVALFDDESVQDLLEGAETEYAFGEAASESGGEVYEDALKNPEDVVVRFHVRANSDSEADLELKYEVRDAVLAAISDGLSEAETDSEAILYLAQNLPVIRQAARETVAEAGFDYEVQAYLVQEEFPIREYGELVLPAGTYRALRVDIGAAGGENFWCLLYPMMCYTTDAGAVVDSQDAEKLEQALDEESYEKLFIKHDCKKSEVKVKIRVAEWLRDMF